MHRVADRNPPIPLHANPASSVSVILIESNSLLKAGLTGVLGSSRFQIVASYSSFEAIPSSLERSPDLIVIGTNHVAFLIDVIKNCSERFPSARRVVLSNFYEEHVMMMLDAGAHACIGNDITSEVLLISLNLVMTGVNIICQADFHLAGQHSEWKCQNGHLSRQSGSNEFSHLLSGRETSVLECLVHGDSNKLIARKFEIAEATVKVHVKAILRKIRAANRTQAAIWAMSHLRTFSTNSGTWLSLLALKTLIAFYSTASQLSCA